ncbi:MAG: NAD(P)-dependent alcohol dehydrogenase [Verrucomicrobiales bacterium]
MPSQPNPAHAPAAMMRAVVHRRYGPPESLAVESVPKPAPAEGEVLIRVRSATLNKGDWHLLTGVPYLIRLAGYGVARPDPISFGQDFAGTVEELGAGVADLAAGDAVFGQVSKGSFAEFAAVPARGLAKKPDSVSFEAAAAIPSSGVTALQAVRDVAMLAPGQSILINGASGGVGSFAVQIAAHLGAEVTGVCSTPNVAFVRELGAHRVIDYREHDFADSGEAFDAIFDTVGNRSLSDCAKALRPGGIYVACAARGGSVLGPFPRFLKMSLFGKLKRRRMAWFIADAKPGDLDFLADLSRRGALKPALGTHWDLDGVPEAVAILGSGRARGKMVIDIA